MKRFLVPGAALLAAAAIFLNRAAPAPPAIADIAPAARVRTPGRHLARSGPVLVVYVVGAVSRPGLYRLPEGSRIDDAVRDADGFLRGADPASVNLAQPLQDGEEIDVTRVGETRASTSGRRTARSRRGTRTSLAPGAIVDLNAADARALESLPGLGPTLAARIVEYRRINGAFASVDELADVAGMTQRRVDAIAPYLTVNAAP